MASHTWNRRAPPRYRPGPSCTQRSRQKPLGVPPPRVPRRYRNFRRPAAAMRRVPHLRSPGTQDLDSSTRSPHRRSPGMLDRLESMELSAPRKRHTSRHTFSHHTIRTLERSFGRRSGLHEAEAECADLWILVPRTALPGTSAVHASTCTARTAPQPEAKALLQYMAGQVLRVQRPSRRTSAGAGLR